MSKGGEQSPPFFYITGIFLLSIAVIAPEIHQTVTLLLKPL
jgi:hypothetical protein